MTSHWASDFSLKGAPLTLNGATARWETSPRPLSQEQSLAAKLATCLTSPGSHVGWIQLGHHFSGVFFSNGCGCQSRFGIPFWLVGEFTTHFRTYLVVGLGCSLGGHRDFDPWPKNGVPKSSRGSGYSFFPFPLNLWLESRRHNSPVFVSASPFQRKWSSAIFFQPGAVVQILRSLLFQPRNYCGFVLFFCFLLFPRWGY